MDELVNEAKLGNKEAFTQIIIEMENELYKIARLRLKNEDDIDDAIQETMIKAFKSIKNKKRIIKFILALLSSAILTTGVVFATGITKYINEFFNSNKGIDTAIENKEKINKYCFI